MAEKFCNINGSSRLVISSAAMCLQEERATAWENVRLEKSGFLKIKRATLLWKLQIY
jgi:hypothetical protein